MNIIHPRQSFSSAILPGRGNWIKDIIFPVKRILLKTTIFAAGAVLLALCAEAALRVLGSRYVTEVPAIERHAGDAYTILCAGDSFTYGAGAPAESSYPRQLEGLLKARFPGRAFRVVNGGEVAQNTAQALRWLPGALAKVKPDCVVLLSGGANSWNYWGYRSGPGPASWPFYERIRLLRLARLLWRSAARPESGPESRPRLKAAGPAQIACMNANHKAADSAAGLKNALELCEKAAAVDGRDVLSMANLGMLHINYGSAEEGLRWLKKAVEIAPENNQLYSSIYAGYLRLNNRAEAEKWLKLGAIKSGGAAPAAFSGGLDTGAWLRKDLDGIIDLVAARKIGLIMQNYPSVGGDLAGTRRASEIIREVAAARGVPFVDQGAVFARLTANGQRDEYFARKDPHCSARGYGVMAAQVADALVKERFVSAGIRP